MSVSPLSSSSFTPFVPTPSTARSGRVVGPAATERPEDPERSEAARAEDADGVGAAKQLTRQEEAEVRALKARDREVKAHEQAHQAVGGQYAGAPSYEYQTGPDDARYAVGGEVPIDASPVPGDPAATIQKMQVVQNAALAPADPSIQDRRVAQKASVTEAKARRELAEEERAGRPGATSPVAAAYAATDPKLDPGFLFDATA